ncbi:MAG: hypothetical protein RI897_416 [Verrucomicrobiota bacterium]|jgi:hypothetical protein
MKNRIAGAASPHGNLARVCLLAGSLAASVLSTQAQRLFFEDFEALPLGHSMEEGVSADGVWTKTTPEGWVADDSKVPGINEGPDRNGVIEWAGWSFADKNWWVQTAGDQRRSEFSLGHGTVMIADPDEWDDATHPGSGVPTDDRTAQGLWYETYITTAGFSAAGVEADSLLLVFASSWRPEFDSNYRQTGVIDVSYDGAAANRVLHWVSDSSVLPWEVGVTEAAFKNDESTNEEIIVPLNNPAGTSEVKLTFGMLDAGNDWWWAVDNVAVGVPPFATSIMADGVSFTVNVVEALGKTVNQGTIVVKLDGTTVAPITVGTTANGLSLTYNQAPTLFNPGQTYMVTVSYTTNDGRTVEDTLPFTAPSYTRVTSTPTSFTAVVTDTEWMSLNEGAGVEVSLDGNTVTAGSVTRTSTNQVTVFYSQSPNAFASGSTHTVALTYQAATGQSLTDSVAFTAPAWVSIPSFLATAPGTGAQSGMRWRLHELDATAGPTRPTTIAGAEDQLAGIIGASIHDPTYHDTPQEADGYFRVDWVNFEQGGLDAGRFNASAPAPLNVADKFIPGSVPPDDYLAAETLGFLELQPGVYGMVVNSDDGFEVTVGTATEQKFLSLGQYDGGRGASDSLFYFNVEQAGVYFFRLLYFEGSGGGSVEWFTVNEDGSAALVGGQQTGAIAAFQTRTVAEPEIPAQGGGIASVSLEGQNLVIEFSGTLKSSASLEGPFEAVNGAVSPYQAPTSDSARFFFAE